MEEIYELISYFVVDNLIASLSCNNILGFLALESKDDFAESTAKIVCLTGFWGMSTV